MFRRYLGRYIALLAVLAVLLPGACLQHAAAATTTPRQSVRRAPGGITISPAFQQIDINQTDTEKTFDFSVTNNTSQQIEVALSAVDFGSLDESGGVLFLGQSDKTINYKYGLSQYVTLQQDRVVVDPKATTKVPVTIDNKESLSPGGHYGAILVTPTDAGGDPSKVQVNQVVSSLLFVTKHGGEVYQLGLQSYELKTHIFSAPSSVDVRFQNAGNVHLIPRGMVNIVDSHDRIVKRGFINEGSGIMLPETFRKFSVPLRTINTAWWPGVYHMTLTYRFDGEEVSHTKSMDFLYVNGWYVVGGMVVLALIILTIVLRPVRRFFRRLWWAICWPFRRLFRLVGKRSKAA